jgi:hypothetical protein
MAEIGAVVLFYYYYRSVQLPWAERQVKNEEFSSTNSQSDVAL